MWKELKDKLSKIESSNYDDIPYCFINDSYNKTPVEVLESIINEHESNGSKFTMRQLIPIYGGFHEEGYEGSARFLLVDPNTAIFYEIHGSHCSCYGFEGQFEPEICPIEYLAKGKQWENAYDTVIKVVKYFDNKEKK